MKEDNINDTESQELILASEACEILLTDNAHVTQIISFISRLPTSVKDTIRRITSTFTNSNNNNNVSNEVFDLTQVTLNANSDALKSLYKKLSQHTNDYDASSKEKSEELSAEEIAVLFSRASGQVEGVCMDDLYFDLNNNNKNNNSGDNNDENTNMMQAIKQELFYLNSLRTQRLAELQLRYELARKNKRDAPLQSRILVNGEEFDTASRNKNGLDTHGQGAKEDEDDLSEDALFLQHMREINFSIAEAEPSMYGMSAQRRLREILLRRKSPEQIVLNGATYGESLTSNTNNNVNWNKLHSTSNEISARSARRAFYESEIDYINNKDANNNNNNSNKNNKSRNGVIDQKINHAMYNFLPHLTKSRTSYYGPEESQQQQEEEERRRQQERLSQIRMRNRELDERYDLNTPRDAASYHAFNEVTNLFSFDNVNRYLSKYGNDYYNNNNNSSRNDNNNNNIEAVNRYLQLPALQERLYEFKMLLRAAQTRIYSFLSPNHSVQNEKIRERLGEPFVMPFTVSGSAIPIHPRSNNNNNSNNKSTMGYRGGNRIPLPHTTWNYGVPIDDALSMLAYNRNEEEQSEEQYNHDNGNNKNEEGSCDCIEKEGKSVLFVPAGLRGNGLLNNTNTNTNNNNNNIANEERKRFKWQQDALEHLPHGALTKENEQQLLMLLQSSTTSSSALAANRLSQLFALSMHDPTVVGSLPSHAMHYTPERRDENNNNNNNDVKAAFRSRISEIKPTVTKIKYDASPRPARTFQEYQRQRQRYHENESVPSLSTQSNNVTSFNNNSNRYNSKDANNNEQARQDDKHKEEEQREESSNRTEMTPTHLHTRPPSSATRLSSSESQQTPSQYSE